MSEDERKSREPETSAAPSTSSSDSRPSRPAAAERHASRRDTGTIIASLIGFLALIVAGYTAYVQHRSTNVLVKQARAQVWPYLEVSVGHHLPPNSGFSESPSNSAGFTFSVRNKGAGPAIVRGFEIMVNGKPLQSWGQVFTALGLKIHLTEAKAGNLRGNVLAPGDRINLLSMTAQKHRVAALFSKLSAVTVRTCYCSTLGECWMQTVDFSKTLPSRARVHSCHVIPANDEFKGAQELLKQH